MEYILIAVSFVVVALGLEFVGSISTGGFYIWMDMYREVKRIFLSKCSKAIALIISISTFIAKWIMMILMIIYLWQRV